MCILPSRVVGVEHRHAVSTPPVALVEPRHEGRILRRGLGALPKPGGAGCRRIVFELRSRSGKPIFFALGLRLGFRLGSSERLFDLAPLLLPAAIGGVVGLCCGHRLLLGGEIGAARSRDLPAGS